MELMTTAAGKMYKVVESEQFLISVQLIKKRTEPYVIRNVKRITSESVLSAGLNALMDLQIKDLFARNQICLS